MGFRECRLNSIGLGLAATVVLSCTMRSADAQDLTGQDPDQPFAVAAAASTDRNLFALHLLNDIYTNWPDLKGDRQSVGTYFRSARTSATAMQGLIRAGGMDPKMALLFSDCLEYIAATEAYLSNLELINKQQSNTAFWDAVSSLWDAAKVASDVQDRAGIVMSPKNAADAGKLVGAADALVTYSGKSQTTDAAATAARAEQARRLETRWNTTYATAQNVARQLSTKYGWANGAAGFDDFQSSQISDYVARTPDDPFVQERYGNLLFQTAKTGNSEVPAINAFLTAARSVPSDPAFQSLRAQYLAEASRAALTGALIDANYTYLNKPASVVNAMKMARTYLAENPNDAGGFGHASVSRALGLSGRIPEAVTAAQTALHLGPEWRSDAQFALHCAKLASLRGDPDDAIGWLSQAFQDGLSWVKYVGSDPDMSTVRRSRAAKFQDLLTPKWTATIRYYASGDDVFFQNNSEFDLTHLHLRLQGRQGGRVWDQEVTLDWIKAGTSYEFKNVFNIPNNYLDESKASLSSDQGTN